jgi:hypothetical protein
MDQQDLPALLFPRARQVLEVRRYPWVLVSLVGQRVPVLPPGLEVPAGLEVLLHLLYLCPGRDPARGHASQRPGRAHVIHYPGHASYSRFPRKSETKQRKLLKIVALVFAYRLGFLPFMRKRTNLQLQTMVLACIGQTAGAIVRFGYWSGRRMSRVAKQTPRTYELKLIGNRVRVGDAKAYRPGSPTDQLNASYTDASRTPLSKAPPHF